MKHIRPMLVCFVLLLVLAHAMGCSQKELPEDKAPDSTAEAIPQMPKEPGEVDAAPDTQPDVDMIVEENTSPVAIALGGKLIPLETHLLRRDIYDRKANVLAEKHIVHTDEKACFEALSDEERAALPVLTSLSRMNIRLPQNAGIVSGWYTNVANDGQSNQWGVCMTIPALAAAQQPGEYYIALQILERGDDIEGTEQYERLYYAAFFRYSHTPPIRKTFDPVGKITFKKTENERVLFWYEDVLSVPGIFPIYAEEGGLCVDYVTDLNHLAYMGEFVPSELLTVESWKVLNVDIPRKTTCKTFVVYSCDEQGKYTRVDGGSSTDIMDTLAELPAGEWIVGLQMQERDTGYVFGYIVYIKYLVP